MSFQRLVVVVGLLLAVPAMADVYRYVDDKGNLVLTDTPPKDKGVADKVERVESKPIMTVPAFQPKGPSKPGPAAAPAKKPALEYAIVIQSPEAGSFFQKNAGEPIPVAVSVSPSVSQGHRLVYFLDGKEQAGELGSLQAEELDRGTHKLEVKVLDASGAVVSAAGVEFGVQQASAKGPTSK